MQNFTANPSEMVASAWRSRRLIHDLVYREVTGRYKGSLLGIVWSLITPVSMLAVYTFVFSVVFKARWSAGSDSKTEFALILFAGLLVYNLFAECVSRAPGLILAHANYVKKIKFPLDVLPWVVMGSALFHFAVSFIIWIAAYALLIGVPHWTLLLTPLIMAPLVLFVMGLSWVLASMGVFLRDIGQIIGVSVQVLMFMTPIFYPTSALPENFQIFIFLNPMTSPVEMMRAVMYWGKIPSLTLWIISFAVSMAVATFGFAWFQKTRKGFADVL